jgi:hypothetical protein
MTSVKSWNEMQNDLNEAMLLPDFPLIDFVSKWIESQNKQNIWLSDDIIAYFVRKLDVNMSDKIYEKVFDILNVFDYQCQSHKSIMLVTTCLVQSLWILLNNEYKTTDELVYETTFITTIPDKLIGYEGIWRIIFSYHYSTFDENYRIIIKGFFILKSIIPLYFGIIGKFY